MRSNILRIYLLGVACLMMVTNTFAQISPKCTSDEMRKILLEKYPEIKQREEAFEQFAANFTASNFKIGESNYVIPVVFHIIHNYGQENISDEQVYEAIERINEDFSKNNNDFAETVTEFLGIAADCQVEFRLAQRQLSGTCTNGIDRIASMRTYTGGDAAKLGGWQNGFYLNIWVVDFLSGNAAAYAYYPTAIGDFLAPVDGVICRYDYVGSTGEAGPYSAHTLSHEIGHYLNLQHTWGNTNAPGVECGDDQVSDTPITKGWLTCNLAGSSCAEPLDNVQNFMEYSYCSTMFTEGQKARMYAALNSTDAARNHLWSEDNHILTGISDGYEPGLCLPVADFYTTNRMICSGETATFHDVSWNGEVENRSWEFSNATPSTSTETDPEVSFNTTGWQTVTLTVTNASGSNSKTFEEYLYVSDDIVTLDKDYFGDFNDGTEVANTWLLNNRYPDEYKWNWRSTNGYGNTGCLWLNSRFGPDAETDHVISPSFDLSDGTTEIVYFKYSTTSYAPTEDNYTMKLNIYYSTTCGKTWINMGNLTGEELISSYGGSSNFFPLHYDQWRSAEFDLPSSAKSENVKFKIEFVYNNYVNNVFIDDFNFSSGALSASDNVTLLDCNILPNPVGINDNVLVDYYLINNSNTDITVSDITGHQLFTVELGNQDAGSHQFNFIPADYNMTKGYYFITLSDKSNHVVEKLLVL